MKAWILFDASGLPEFIDAELTKEEFATWYGKYFSQGHTAELCEITRPSRQHVPIMTLRECLEAEDVAPDPQTSTPPQCGKPIHGRDGHVNYYCVLTYGHKEQCKSWLEAKAQTSTPEESK